jgi:hypothetical protein
MDVELKISRVLASYAPDAFEVARLAGHLSPAAVKRLMSRATPRAREMLLASLPPELRATVAAPRTTATTDRDREIRKLRAEVVELERAIKRATPRAKTRTTATATRIPTHSRSSAARHR